MNVRELIDFLSKYDEETIVTMVQCAEDNLLADDLMIKRIVAIEDNCGDISIVIVPE